MGSAEEKENQVDKKSAHRIDSNTVKEGFRQARYVHAVPVTPPESDTASVDELPLSTVGEAASLVPPSLED